MRFLTSLMGLVACTVMLGMLVVTIYVSSDPQVVVSRNDRLVQQERERTERALSRDAAFERLGMTLIVVGGVLGGIWLMRRGGSVPQVAQPVQLPQVAQPVQLPQVAQPVQLPPPHIVVLAAPLLQQRGGRELVQLDGEWLVADHERAELLSLPAPGARRLPG